MKRGIYYCSRMVSAQYGAELTESHYEDIKKVYSLWVCMNPPKGRAGSITRYSIQEENLVGDVREQRDCYDLLTTIMICLGEEEEEQDSGVLKLLETLLSSEKDPAAKKKTLEEEFAIPVTQTLEREVSLMCNLSKGIEEKGIQKGMQKGIQEGTLLSIRSLMKSMNWTAEEAMIALRIEEPERSHYAERIEKEH